MRNAIRATALAFVVLLASLAAPGAAVAAPGGDRVERDKTVMLTAPMHAVGYDAKVAKANGYEIRTASDGTPYSVPIGSTEGPSPQNRLPGECGYSHVYFTPIGGRKAVINTGFDSTQGPAVDFSWAVTVTDDWGVSVKTWGGPLLFRSSWVGTHTFTSSGYGWAYADVTTGLVILATGWICYSYGPWAAANIF
jgi:hypothetical protein